MKDVRIHLSRDEILLSKLTSLRISSVTFLRLVMQPWLGTSLSSGM
jgi:hypothetical protein